MTGEDSRVDTFLEVGAGMSPMTTRGARLIMRQALVQQNGPRVHNHIVSVSKMVHV